MEALDIIICPWSDDRKCVCAGCRAANRSRWRHSRGSRANRTYRRRLRLLHTLTTVEPSFIVLELKDAAHKKKLPDRKTKSAITKQDWENLQRAIDRKSLTAVPQTVCRAAIDLPCSWVEVEFSDRTKIGVSYDRRNPPAPVAAGEDPSD
jgi:hypothetical protein